jgi:hypothetical protein
MDSIEDIRINGHLLTDNPVLDGSDLLVGENGHYIKNDDTI